MFAKFYVPLKKILSRQQIYPGMPKAYKLASRFFGCPLIDRTNTLKSGIRYQIIDPLPQYLGVTDDFGRICLAVGEQIADRAVGEKMDVDLLWSGGIDSTAALIALYEALKKKSEPERLKVVYSTESVKEYPSFFEDIIKDNIRHKKYTPPVFGYLRSQRLIVTGEHGDQLFGSDKSRIHVMSGEAFRPYKELLPFVVNRRLGSRTAGDRVLAYLEPQIAKSPIPIETLYDCLWWINFSLKWQHVSLRIPRRAINLTLDENVIHFFRDGAFQQWAYRDASHKIKDTWESYKYIAKEFIYHYHPDDAYLAHKEKEQSLKDVISRRKE